MAAPTTQSIYSTLLQEIKLYFTALYTSQRLDSEQYSIRLCSPLIKGNIEGEVMVTGCHKLMKHLLQKCKELNEVSQILNEFLTTLKDVILIKAVTVSQSYIISLQINKIQLIKLLINEVLESDYMCPQIQNISTFLYPYCPVKGNTPVTMETGRLLMVSNLLSRMFNVPFHVPNQVTKNAPKLTELLSNQKQERQLEENNDEILCHKLIDKIQHLATVESSHSLLQINVQMFLTSSSLYGKKNFPSNIKTVTVKECGVLTPVGQLVADINHTLLDQNKKCSILLITAQKHVHVALQSISVLLASSPCLSLKLLEVAPPVVSPITTTNNDIEEYINSRYVFTRHACETKYGPIQKGSELERIANTMGEAAVKFELLSTDPKNTLKLVVSQPDCQSVMVDTYFEGTFVLYNYARIAMIERNFNIGVEKGIYPSLPSLKDIDFSLLSDQSEWELLYYYIFQYPLILNESRELFGDIKVNSGLKKICQFLIKLCHSFSQYYSRVKVLLAPEYQLIPLIHARLTVILTIKKVIYNGLQLLGITPLEQL